MQKGYYATAVADLKSTSGWFGKLCLLALLNFIPIFGQIVTFGYLYGWARDIAWGLNRPMPAKIFGNEDGKLYSRGFFAIVIAIIFSLVPDILFGISDALSGAAVGTGAYYFYGSLYDGGIGPGLGSAIGAGMLSGVVWLIGIVAAVLVFFFTEIGIMRMSVYGRLSAGFQAGKIWRMFRHEPRGMWHVFGMNLLVTIIICAVAFIVLLVVGLGAVAAAFASGVLDPGYFAQGDLYYGTSPRMVVSSIGAGIVFLLVVVYFLLVGSVFVEAITARAMGYWTQQFQVDQWQGQDAPMPFERQAQAAQGAYPGGPNAQAAWQQPQAGWQQPNQQPQTGWQQPNQQPQNGWQQTSQQPQTGQPQTAQQPYSGQQQPGQGVQNGCQSSANGMPHPGVQGWQQPGAQPSVPGASAPRQTRSEQPRQSVGNEQSAPMEAPTQTARPGQPAQMGQTPQSGTNEADSSAVQADKGQNEGEDGASKPSA